MDENATHALMLTFGLFVLIIALSISMYMFGQVTNIAEKLIYYSDSTNYYDSIKFDSYSYNNDPNRQKEIIPSVERYVNTETIIPTLYRYDKENFCVKIYDATVENEGSPKLIQIFDRNIENNVNRAVSDSKATASSKDKSSITNYAYKQIFDNKEKKPEIFMFGAPWTGSPEDIKSRLDLYISGTAGYIEGVYVDYTNNNFSKAVNVSRTNPNNIRFKERFISYSYTGDTFVTDDGDELVNVDAKDKLVIIYTILGKYSE